jgi:septation ring formation regulator EzrA
MSVKIELSIEQVAQALKTMKKDELETLEILVDPKTEKEIIKRREEARSGKTVPMEQIKSFRNI